MFCDSDIFLISFLLLRSNMPRYQETPPLLQSMHWSNCLHKVVSSEFQIRRISALELFCGMKLTLFKNNAKYLLNVCLDNIF